MARSSSLRHHPSVPREGGFQCLQWSSRSPRVFLSPPRKAPKRPSGRHGKWPTKVSASHDLATTLPPPMDDPGSAGGRLMNGAKFISSPSSFRAPRRRVSVPSVVIKVSARVPVSTTEGTEAPIRAARKAADEGICFARSGHASSTRQLTTRRIVACG